jgi:hypothetical protein
VTGEIEAGQFAAVSLQLGDGETIEMDVPVVTNCGDFEGLDGPSSPEQCESPSESPEH